MTEQEYRTALQMIIKGTEKLDFPMLASFEKRQKILVENRMNIDLLIDSVQSNRGTSADEIAAMRPALWEEADAAARAEFGDLSEKKMLNGFYLQEVMHRYAELQVAVLLSHLDH